jgi:hypothetical protein
VSTPPQAGVSPFLPLLVFFLAWLGWAGFQAYQLRAESKTLAALKASQEAPLQQAQQVRQRLDALATETQKLADAGNPNARTVIDELRKRGITVKPPAR